MPNLVTLSGRLRLPSQSYYTNVTNDNVTMFKLAIITVGRMLVRVPARRGKETHGYINLGTYIFVYLHLFVSNAV